MSQYTLTDRWGRTIVARGTIVAICGDWAWVRHDREFGGGWSTFHTRYLARAEPA